jgi:hypothetical protein
MEFNNIVDILKPLLKVKSYTLEELVTAADHVSEDKVLRAIQWLVDNEKIRVDAGKMYRWE